MKSWAKIDGPVADYLDANWLREPPISAVPPSGTSTVVPMPKLRNVGNWTT